MRPLHVLIPVAMALGTSVAPYAAQAQVALDVSITAAPPELPVYEQPPLPEPGYIFMPGYWAYGYSGYYWVPGTWVEPPQPGLLWTPGYWGWNAGRYIFNAGYWGPTVGFYGGINYGFGYGGLGYEGGYWRGGSFFYNRAVNNFGSVHVTNVFERNVTNVTVNRYSFNGPNGVVRQPSAVELTAARSPHVPPTTQQMQHVQAAQQNRALLASVNHGRPAVLATPRAGAFNGGGNANNGNGTGRGVVRGGSPTTVPVPGPRPIVRATTPTRPYGTSYAASHQLGSSETPRTPAPRPVLPTAGPHPTIHSPAPREAGGTTRTMVPRGAPPPAAVHAPTSAPRPMAPPHDVTRPGEEKPRH